MNKLIAQERKDFKKSTLKKMRNNERIPAIVYGSDSNTESIVIKNADLRKVIRAVGRNGTISLSLDGKLKNVILRDYQSDPITKDVLHVDFLQIDKHTEIDVKVGVVLKGTSSGEKGGGVVKQFLHELDVTAKANDIPDDVVIDITDFDIGHTVRVEDVKKHFNNCTINNEDDETIVTIDYLKPESATEEGEESSQTEASGV